MFPDLESCHSNLHILIQGISRCYQTSISFRKLSLSCKLFASDKIKVYYRNRIITYKLPKSSLPLSAEMHHDLSVLNMEAEEHAQAILPGRLHPYRLAINTGLTKVHFVLSLSKSQNFFIGYIKSMGSQHIQLSSMHPVRLST